MTRPDINGARPTLCSHALAYERFHPGFSNQGYLYRDRDETVLTWSAYNPHYKRRVDKQPWMLTADEKLVVEAALKPCPCGGRFAFANTPRCPQCHAERRDLASDTTYYVVLGRRVDGDTAAAWLDEPKI
jgi:hypothetical protein